MKNSIKISVAVCSLILLQYPKVFAQNDITPDRWVDENNDIITESVYNDPLYDISPFDVNWDGNVGINEYAPQRYLHISKQRMAADESETVHNTTGIRLTLDFKSGSEGAVRDWDMFTHRDNYLGFKSANTDLATMRIHNGHVGLNLDHGMHPEGVLHLKYGYVQVGLNADPYKARYSANALEFNRPFRSYIIQKDPTGQIAFGIPDANSVRMIIDENGRVGIGLTNPSETLQVAGKIKADALDICGHARAQEITVEVGGWCDYVFEEDYQLRSLDEVEEFINENGHLPEIPTTAQVDENGVELGKMNALLLKKVEELTLYIIQQEKRLDNLESRN